MTFRQGHRGGGAAAWNAAPIGKDCHAVPIAVRKLFAPKLRAARGVTSSMENMRQMLPPIWPSGARSKSSRSRTRVNYRHRGHLFIPSLASRPLSVCSPPTASTPFERMTDRRTTCSDIFTIWRWLWGARWMDQRRSNSTFCVVTRPERSRPPHIQSCRSRSYRKHAEFAGTAC